MLKKILAFVLIAVMAISVVACGGGSGDDNNGNGGNGTGGDDRQTPVLQAPDRTIWEHISAIQDRFPASTATGQGVGGFLNFALVSANQFTGIHNPAFSLLADDGTINDFMFISMLFVYENNFYNHNGPAWFEYSVENATFTVHMHDTTAMYWWDGVPVSMYDVLFAYEVIAYPGFESSPRFGPATNTSTVLGIDEYRENPEVGISGIRVFNDGRSIEFSYESIDPSILIGAVWTTPLPRHHFEGIPMIDIPDHANSRQNPLGNGAFMFDHSVPGESIRMLANPNFWQGAPALDGINLEVVQPALIGEAMLSGNHDLAAFTLSAVVDYEDRLTNAQFISALDRRLDFMGFRHGTRDNATGVVTNDPDSPMNCVYLRRALGYSREDAVVAEMLFGGFRFPISTTMVPWQGEFMYEGIHGFNVFDLDYANYLLDSAGYEWRDGEEFRRHNVTGEPFQLVWLIANNFIENYEKVPHHQQNWARVGLDVVLFENRLVTLAERTELLTNDTDNGVINIYDATWLVGSNPNPTSLWGNSVHNATRYESAELTAILDAINSEAAWDFAYLLEQYHEFQRYVYRNAPWVPVTTAVLLWAANNRVLNYSLDRGVDDPSLPGNGRWHLWDLSSATPYSAR